MSRSAVDALGVAQGDECALCGDRCPGHLDHDHESGRVRALLCGRCNTGLGSSWTNRGDCERLPATSNGTAGVQARNPPRPWAPHRPARRLHRH